MDSDQAAARTAGHANDRRQRNRAGDIPRNQSRQPHQKRGNKCRRSSDDEAVFSGSLGGKQTGSDPAQQRGYINTDTAELCEISRFDRNERGDKQ